MEFKAFVVDQVDGEITAEIQTVDAALLTDAVRIKIDYASINYKDGLSTIANSGVIGTYPIIPGIDFSGTIIASDDAALQVGQQVAVMSHNILKYQSGGFAEYAAVPASEVTVLPKKISTMDAAIIGTAGYTAALAINRIINEGIQPEDGSILVLGATGGVGSIAIAMLRNLGYNVTVASRKPDAAKLFASLDIDAYIDTNTFIEEKPRALNKMKWAAVIDPIGGMYVSYLLPYLAQNGCYCLCGNVAGAKFDATVFPFILRGITLCGINSVGLHGKADLAAWELLADFVEHVALDRYIDEMIKLDEVPAALQKILGGRMVGRTIVKM